MSGVESMNVSNFAALGLCKALLQAMQECGFDTPTPVQAAALPPALQGRDVLATAQTGSGKTLAFVLPILQQLENAFEHGGRKLVAGRRPTRALILVPTRELAMQVVEYIQELSPFIEAPLRWACVYGGVSINPQMMGLRGGADIVVATPGRLLDLVDHNAVHLGDVRTLVLDEADRLLDTGFADELQRVLALLPKRRQHLLFSATFAPEVEALAQGLLQGQPHEAVRIDIPSGPVTAPDIAQRAIEVDVAQRTPLLRHLLKQEGWQQVLVFVATRYASELVADKLQRHGFAAAAFHADASQGARREALHAFKAGRLQVVVATDLAARGIDIALLPVVVNYDLPRSADDHVHRIGRTGRAGASGLAVSFITPESEAHFRLIEKRQGQRVPREQVAGFEPAPRPAQALAPTDGEAAGLPSNDPNAPHNGGIKGKRKSKKDKLREAAARGG